MAQQLIELLERFTANPNVVSRADIDEFAMRTEAASGSLPSRFVDITRKLDSEFDSEYANIFGENYIRLSRVLEVFETLPKIQNNESVASDLLPTFELNEFDKERVLELCSKMRKIILATNIFDQPHRRRLLNRIAGIEHQVEQPRGLLDVVRAGVSDVGEALGKFGTDIKPLTDRMKEVAQIARSSSKEYDQIPAPDEIKQLPKPNDGEGSD
jgi:hypothetical protein